MRSAVHDPAAHDPEPPYDGEVVAVVSATFEFPHPSNFIVNRPASPVTEGPGRNGLGQNAG
jgi:hypothetical protein